MKPLLILPPAANRWPALEALLDAHCAAECADLRQRVANGVDGATDAIAMQPDGGQAIAAGVIRRRGDLGLLGPLLTRPDHRRTGIARRLLQTLLAWFDMTGGRRLYLVAPAEYLPEWLAHFGFRPLHFAGDPLRVSLARTAAGLPDDPLDGVESQPERVGPLTAADWAGLHALAQHRPGPDARVPLNENALAADALLPELFGRLATKRCVLVGARRGEHLVAAASVAIDAPGARTYALRWPHDADSPALIQAAADAARQHGFEQVEYPLNQV